MTWLTNSIAGRTITILILGLGSILAIAQHLYQAGLEREVSIRNTETIAERLIFLSQSILAIEPEKRDAAAHGLSGGPIELHWGREPLATAGGQLDEASLRLKDRLVFRAPELVDLGLVVGTSRPAAPGHQPEKSIDAAHTTLISIPLSDQSWLNVTLVRVQATRASTPSVLLTALFGALGVVTIAVLMGRWLTRPLERLADGSRRLFLSSAPAQFPETGPREVRTLAAALNDLQDRIRHLIDDRTQMLAAVSHDLRTPLTRLRLRATGLGDGKLRASIEADINEMEDMIEATLTFLREDRLSEPVAAVDLVAILETIVTDASDGGLDVSLEAPRTMEVDGRHLALKRAFSNLIQNASKYGGKTSVKVTIANQHIVVAISDDGPGIPADKLETVFEPFFRMEGARGRGTGGHGLGLTIARSIMRAHGGDVVLINRTPTGLEARVLLPRTTAGSTNAVSA